MPTDALDRFVEAQEASWDTALAELTEGRKRTHWMWFIFPQLASLGHSDMARYYGIADLAEARAYLAHPVLGARLHQGMAALLPHAGTPPDRIMGDIDALKLRSSATLFQAAGGPGPWSDVLETFYAGAPCPLTLAALSPD